MLANRCLAPIRLVVLFLCIGSAEGLDRIERGSQISDIFPVQIECFINSDAGYGAARVSVRVVGLVWIERETVCSKNQSQLFGQQIR